jgi:protein-S-isoprenylcysteine O-methyltransferase Ste14
MSEVPSAWNLAGLMPVIAGFGLMAWCVVVHMRLAPSGWRIEKTPYYPTPAYLVTEGPYCYSRNPIYVAEGMIWIGSIILFGSPVILAVLATLAVVVGPLVLHREEKGLEARFGDAWVRYSSTTPRWFSIRILRGD